MDMSPYCLVVTFSKSRPSVPQIWNNSHPNEPTKFPVKPLKHHGTGFFFRITYQ